MPNVIPSQGVLRGTLRTTEISEWESAQQIFREVVESIVEPYGTEVEIDYHQGVPPVINDAYAVHKIERSILAVHSSDALYHAERSLGGEDFAWYLREIGKNGQKIQGAMMRIGAASPGQILNDIHQPNLIVDEGVLDCAVPFLAHLLLDSEIANAPTNQFELNGREYD
jgi:amidohydrolase